MYDITNGASAEAKELKDEGRVGLILQAKPEHREEGEPEHREEGEPEHRGEAKPEHGEEAKPVHSEEAKPVHSEEAKPEHRGEAKPEHREEAKSEHRGEAKPEHREEAKPEEKSELNYRISFRKSKKPFFSGGRLVLVLTAELPVIECENERLSSCFNSLYTALSEEYERLALEFVNSFANLTRPATLKIKSEIMTTKAYKIEISRTAELRTEIRHRRIEYTDLFDTSLGCLIRTKKRMAK